MTRALNAIFPIIDLLFSQKFPFNSLPGAFLAETFATEEIQFVLTQLYATREMVLCATNKRSVIVATQSCNCVQEKLAL